MSEQREGDEMTLDELCRLCGGLLEDPYHAEKCGARQRLHATWEPKKPASVVSLGDAMAMIERHRVQVTAERLSDILNECRRLVMSMYGGNLDHPALDHLEAAMTSVRQVEINMATAELASELRKPSP